MTQHILLLGISMLTLALLMFLTAAIDWKTFFARKPPALPVRTG